MAEKRYWKGLEEKNANSVQSDEFVEKLPLISELEKADKISTGRRDFLKMMGFSITAATVAASCEMPVRKAIPYIIKPDDVTPGIANYYASTFAEGGDYCSILVKTRDGRPIKIEGNPLSKLTGGGTSAVVQASVLGIYDNFRLQGPQVEQSPTPWSKVDSEIASQLRSISGRGGKIRILSSTIISPSAKKAIADFTATFPGTRHVTYDAVSYSGLLDAAERTVGARVLPGYNFEQADVIVSIGADFLGTWISPVEYANQYGKRRKVSRENKSMNRHIQVESYLSLSGSNADTRIVVKPSEEKTALLLLYNALSGGGAGVTASDALKSAMNAAAADLKKAGGKALVICGINDVNAQLLTLAINNILGSIGTTVDFGSYSNQRQGNDTELTALIDELSTVDALIFWHANPVYNHSEAERFKQALAKIPLTISLNTHPDETTVLCKYNCPDHHYLESWNDAEPRNGSFSITQPTIAPLFYTRSAAETLLKWSGNEISYYDYIRNNWRQNIHPRTNFVSFESFWEKTVHDGVLDAPAGGALSISNIDVGAAANALSRSAPAADVVELVLYEKVTIRDGRFADNPWLQEVPDPSSKVTWDNYAAVSRAMAERLGLDRALGKITKSVGTETDLVKVSANGYEVVLPALVQPGVPDNTIAIALGYGRECAGKAGTGIGKNTYPFLRKVGNYPSKYIETAVIEKVGGSYLIAQTQMHHSIFDGLNVRPIIKETTLAEYSSNPFSGNEDRKKVREHLVSLYPKHAMLQKGHHWEMTIDLNSCIGCSACVVACTVENNVPVVGKLEVSRSREMHWLRIDRYFSGDEENPSVVFQPMLCQHCDNAPCENVCPVAATVHGSEGINQMAYNRCIGTRYCANNCPYKVRRFNWFDYLGADSFKQGTIFNNDQDPFGMTEDLTRMVLNPDVTVRARGVMEKCSFCVQRIQEGKLKAKKIGRALQDGDIVTACQNACPTNAITFGDLNNEESTVYKLANDERGYKVLEEIHTLPSITYLTKVRNREKTEA